MEQPRRSSLQKPAQDRHSASRPTSLSPRFSRRGTSSAQLSKGNLQDVPSSPEPRPQIDLRADSLKDSVALHCRFTLQGAKDAFAWPASLISIYGSKTIQINTFKCFLLNGLIFLGSIFLFDYAILPISHRLWAYRGRPDQNVKSAEMIDTLFSITYYVLWVYPMYLISFMLNAVWYQRIADRSYRVQVGKPVSNQFTYERLLTTITDEAYRGLLLLNYLIQSIVIYMIPYAGPPACFICFCWIASFYSFEYKWANKGWSLKQRIDHFEEHWAYFIGFGFPCTLFTFFFPQFISQGLFALLFPMYIIMSNGAKPLPRPNEIVTTKYIPRRLPIFKFAIGANAFCINRLLKRRTVPTRPRVVNRD
ncbi:hypothetical protein SpCBS45565_g05990 [Spizellomyces sp. 'palustris']|nr:hypothetical protein SpCBS45565_g05990 [Spizellomyces sp. 'palustris']